MNGWPTDHHVKTSREIAGHRPQSDIVTGQHWKIGGLVNVASRPSFNDVQRQPQLAASLVVDSWLRHYPPTRRGWNLKVALRSHIQPHDRCFLVMEHCGAEYVGALLLDDPAFCRELSNC